MSLSYDQTTKEDIKRQVEAIRKVTERVLAGGKEVCLKFLIDAGIIKPE